MLFSAVGCSDDAATDQQAPSAATAVVDSSLPTSSSSGATSSSADPDAVLPEGFTSIEATVTLSDGTLCELCLWLADTAEERSRGLMAVTDLGGADGMAFVYEAPSQGRFWMRGTPMALSIAFFAADGSFVSTTEMEPCLAGPDDACPRYGADGAYTVAIELPAGEVVALGVTAGSRLDLGTGSGCADAVRTRHRG